MMTTNVFLRAGRAALVALVWSGCAAESDWAAGPPPRVAGHAQQSLEGEPSVADAGPSAIDAGPSAIDAGPSACVDTLDALTPPECAACAGDYCADEAASCGETCGSLLSCASAHCAPRDITCITSTCSECTQAAMPANVYASCLQWHCASSCPQIARLAIAEPQPPPTPTPSPSCVDDLPGALGADCTACIDNECIAQRTSCDSGCRSLISCAIGECGGGEDLACVTGQCGGCLSGVTAAQALAGCVASQCASACPALAAGPTDPTVPDAGPSAPDAGAGDVDHDRDGHHHKHKHKRHRHHGRHHRGR